ncbi:MAG TPA: CotH kinase family protein [Kofleriaceae bacterium]|nr:CotH kinase family protein [Kofleriaceae bacterium]
MGRALRTATWAACALVAACGGGAGPAATDAAPEADAGPDVDAPPRPPPGQQVFSTAVLHTIAITVDPMYLDALENDVDARVPCTFTFDGVTLTDVGIRKKGGQGSVSSLFDKTGFSVKLNEFVGGQRLDGLEKVVLDNCQEDPTFVSSHVGYDAHRAMGGAAPFTSHATVSFNGGDYGLFVVEEPTGDDFLDRVFGHGDTGGNLYEGTYHQENHALGDFVTHPEALELKDEDQGRTRDDMVAFATAVRTADDAGLEAALRAHLDLDHYLTALAVDTVVGYWDSYAYFLNNYYFYDDPAAGTFRYIPHGMDQLRYRDPGAPLGLMVRRIRQVPALSARLDDELARVRASWDVAAMTARVDQVEAILAAAPTGGRTEADVASFRAHVDEVRADLAAIPTGGR